MDVGRDTDEKIDERARLLDRGDDGARLDELTEDLRCVVDGARRVRRLVPGVDDATIRRLADGEPVNPVAGEDDLRRRVAGDRRCYVLEHPDMPHRPLGVVWVALVRGVPDDLGALLDPSSPELDPGRADTAAFYSIWNVEPGLVGLPLGHRLIDGAVEAVREELPGVATAVTLSPVPGLRDWMADVGTLPPGEPATGAPPPEVLADACARYLTTVGDDGRLLDPVARFHMGNGARLWALAPGADRSERGMRRSLGMMANYRYEPEDRAANRAALADGRPALGPGVAARSG